VSELKTKPTDTPVADVVAALPDERKRQDAEAIVELMQEITGQPPVLWGSSIIGFGSHHYVYPTGNSGDWPPIAFSPRKTAFTIYLMGELDPHEERLTRLGKHTRSKGCLYIKRLSDVDIAVLREIVEASHREFVAAA
jgi:hypothetical protein